MRDHPMGIIGYFTLFVIVLMIIGLITEIAALQYLSLFFGSFKPE